MMIEAEIRILSFFLLLPFLGNFRSFQLDQFQICFRGVSQKKKFSLAGGGFVGPFFAFFCLHTFVVSFFLFFQKTEHQAQQKGRATRSRSRPRIKRSTVCVCARVKSSGKWGYQFQRNGESKTIPAQTFPERYSHH